MDSRGNNISTPPSHTSQEPALDPVTCEFFPCQLPPTHPPIALSRASITSNRSTSKAETARNISNAIEQSIITIELSKNDRYRTTSFRKKPTQQEWSGSIKESEETLEEIDVPHFVA
jgi:hypothetical protein